MRCELCGVEFTPSGHGSPPRYCSARCRKKAFRQRRKTGGTAQPAPSKPRTRPMEASPAPRVSSAAASGGGHAPLKRAEFERMMAGTMEDVILHNLDVLTQRLDDPDTPANAVAAISRQIVALRDRLDQLAGDDPLLAPADDDGEEVAAGDWTQFV